MAGYAKTKYGTYAKLKKGKDQKQDKDLKIIKKKIKAIEPELKCRHFTLGATTFDNGVPIIWTINGLLKGTNVDNRLGNFVRAKSFDINLQVYANTTLQHDTICRVMIVKESTCLGSPISLLQLLGSATPLTYSVRNLQNRDANRFTIIKDKLMPIGVVSTSQNGAGVTVVPHSNTTHIKNMHFTIKRNELCNHARGNASTEADIETNAFYLIVFTDVTTVNCLSARAQVNYRYTDA